MSSTPRRHRLYMFGPEKLRVESMRIFERIGSCDPTTAAQEDGTTTTILQTVLAENVDGIKVSDKEDALIILMDPTQPSSSYPSDMYQSLRAFTNCKRAYFIASNSNGVDGTRQNIENARTKWNDTLSRELNVCQEISCTSKSASEAICKLETWLHSDVETPLPNPKQDETKSLEDNLSWFLSDYAKSTRLNSTKSLQILPSILEPPLLKFSIQDMSNLPTKTPALHWSDHPLCGESQLGWRIRFPVQPVPEQWAQDIIGCNSPADAVYTYRWTQGSFLQFPTAKLCIWLTENSVQLCVRCDQEELGEEGGGPVEDVLWNTAAIHLYSIINALNHIPMVPYLIELIPFGSPFYSKVVETEQVYRLEQVLSWLESGQDSYDFTVKDSSTGDLLYASLQITKIFPGFRPICLEDIRIRLCQGRQRERASRKSSSPVQRTTASNPSPLSVNFTSDAVVSSPSKRRMSDVSGPRGRRVSFGHVLVEDAKKVSIECKSDGVSSTVLQSNST